MEIILVYLFIGAICGVLAANIADPEKSTFAFTLGLLLGPFGVLIAAIIRK